MAILRLASSTVVPNSLRAIPSSSILSESIANYAFSGTQYIVVKSAIDSNCISRNFSTEAKKQLLDRKLVKFLKSEIRSRQLSLQKSKPSVPAHFPFTIQNHPNWYSDPDWETAMTLKRELNGEKIEVLVRQLPEWFFGSTDISDDDSDDEVGNEDSSSTDSISDEQKEKYHADPEPHIRLEVKISKEYGKEMEFWVSASADEIEIQSMSVKEPAASSLICHGPRGVRDSELQFALREFLEIRGIKKSYVNFLYKYMAWNTKLVDKVHSYESLKKLKQYMKKSAQEH